MTHETAFLQAEASRNAAYFIHIEVRGAASTNPDAIGKVNNLIHFLSNPKDMATIGLALNAITESQAEMFAQFGQEEPLSTKRRLELAEIFAKEGNVAITAAMLLTLGQTNIATQAEILSSAYSNATQNEVDQDKRNWDVKREERLQELLLQFQTPPSPLVS